MNLIINKFLVICVSALILLGVACGPQTSNQAATPKEAPAAGDQASAPPGSTQDPESVKAQSGLPSSASSENARATAPASGNEPVANLIADIRQETQAVWRRTCILNLKLIDGCKQQWAIEKFKDASSIPTDADLFGPGLFADAKPACPAGGVYTLNSVRENPTCSHPGHDIDGSSEPVQTKVIANEREGVSPANQCAENRRRIDEAKQRWAAETGAGSDATVNFEDLYLHGKGLEELLICPEGGYYYYNQVGLPTTCSHPGHGSRNVSLVRNDKKVDPPKVSDALGKRLCAGYLKMIVKAKDQWVHAVNRNPPDLKEVNEAYGSILLLGYMSCPGGGIYSLNAMGEDPTCSCPGHGLEK